jgi:hypothetical protein
MHSSIFEIPGFAPLEFWGQLFSFPDVHHVLELHSVHTPPLKPLYPRSHTHQSITVDPWGPCELAGHGLHTVEFIAATTALYVLFWHAWQSDRAVLPVASENVPATHSLHSLSSTPCKESRYFPFPHMVHPAAPVWDAYVPISHALHDALLPSASM